MSHLAVIKIEVKDLEAVKAACQEMGLTFHQGQTHYGRLNEQAALIQGQCAHAISHPSWDFCGDKLEIGLVKSATGYRLEMDDWNTGPAQNVGKDAGKFLQLYAVHKATLECKRKGYLVTRSFGESGKIRLQVSVTQ
jgi:hypothetical protein